MMDTIRRFHAAQPVIDEIQGTMNNNTLAMMRTHCTGFNSGSERAIIAQITIAIAITTLKPEPPEYV